MADSQQQGEAAQQGELFALADVAGYGALTLRERKFVEGMMAGLSRTEAARAAGVPAGKDVDVRVAGSRLASKPRVMAVLAQAWRQSGAKIETTLAQAEEIAMRAAEVLRESIDPKERAQALREWNHASTLKASILGKLNIGLAVSGEVTHRAGLSDDQWAYLVEVNKQLMGQPGKAGAVIEIQTN